jgi:hypothetical protein
MAQRIRLCKARVKSESSSSKGGDQVELEPEYDQVRSSNR